MDFLFVFDRSFAILCMRCFSQTDQRATRTARITHVARHLYPLTFIATSGSLRSHHPNGGNVYYVTKQITFLTRKFQKRNVICTHARTHARTRFFSICSMVVCKKIKRKHYLWFEAFLSKNTNINTDVDGGLLFELMVQFSSNIASEQRPCPIRGRHLRGHGCHGLKPVVFGRWSKLFKIVLKWNKTRSHRVN